MDAVSEINYKMINKLDKMLYAFFVKTKTRYNKLAPISKDTRVMQKIVDSLSNKLSKFKSKYNMNINHDVDDIIEEVKKIAKAWFDDHRLHFIINSSPMSVERPFTQYIPVPEPHSAIYHQIATEPTIQSQRMFPTLGMNHDMFLG